MLFKNIYNEEEIIVKIAISGGTGFIGKYLSTFLFKKDILFTFSHEKTAETSDPNLQYVQWTPDLQTFPSLLLM